jgi:hypothetical protein
MNYLIFAGLAVVGLFLLEKSVVLGNLRFIASGSTIDFSSPLRPLIKLSVVIQNPTSGSVTVQSLAGNFFINGQQAGNVSYFTPVIIVQNSQTEIVLDLLVNDFALVQIITNYMTGGGGSVVVAINGTANVNNVPAPFSITFTPIQ